MSPEPGFIRPSGRNIFGLKIIALLSQVRWYNILLTIIAQYLAAVYTLDRKHSHLETLLNPKLHFIIFSCAFIIAAGFLINNFYDKEKDFLNRPKLTLFNNLISNQFTLNLYLFFNFIGLLLAFWVSLPFFAFNLFFAFALWFYSHKLQKIPLLREVSASCLSVASFFSIGLHYRFISLPMFVFGCLMMLIIFIREILKSLEAYKGDLVYGYQTIAVVFGIQKTKYIIWAFSFMAFLPVAALFFLHPGFYLKISLGTLALGICLGIYMLRGTESPKDFKKENTLYKIMILIGVVSVVFF